MWHNEPVESDVKLLLQVQARELGLARHLLRQSATGFTATAVLIDYLTHRVSTSSTTSLTEWVPHWLPHSQSEYLIDYLTHSVSTSLATSLTEWVPHWLPHSQWVPHWLPHSQREYLIDYLTHRVSTSLARNFETVKLPMTSATRASSELGQRWLYSYMIVAVSLHKIHICIVKSLVKIAAVSWHSLRRFIKPAPGQ